MMKNLITLLITAATLWSCNKVTDPTPNGPQIPSEVVQLVEKTYDNPQNIVFTEIVKNKIWNADLESKSNKYSSVLTSQNVLSSSRLAGSDVPDNLKNLMMPSFVTGGTFSNFREEEYAYQRASSESAFLAEYAWKGNPYLLKWRVTTFDGNFPTMYTLEMAPVSQKFRVTGANDLPEALQQYIQGKGYRFSLAMVLIGNQGKKTYQLYLHKNGVDFQLLFDENSQLLAGSDQSVYLENVDALPADIKNFLATEDDYKDFDFEIGINSITKNEQDGITTYEVRGQKQLGNTGGLDVWLIVFGEDKKPLYREYFALYR
jgi:hypothetical protein